MTLFWKLRNLKRSYTNTSPSFIGADILPNWLVYPSLYCHVSHLNNKHACSNSEDLFLWLCLKRTKFRFFSSNQYAIHIHMYAVVQKQGLIILKIKCLIQNPINIYTFCIVAAILWFLPDRQSFHMYLSIQLVS
jgi:hypothetical protein